jgi:predicted P-loop ATPase
MVITRNDILERGNSMRNFKVAIEEHIVQEFIILADDIDEAMEIARKKYKDGELVVENADVQATLMAAYDPDEDQMTEWSEI